ELQCYLPNNLDDLKNNSYPCIGLRSQDASIEANFGRKKMIEMIGIEYCAKQNNISDFMPSNNGLFFI
ncbi:hypothetical protein C2G38_2065939, partial [Gigaspora rosea]